MLLTSLPVTNICPKRINDNVNPSYLPILLSTMVNADAGGRRGVRALSCLLRSSLDRETRCSGSRHGRDVLQSVLSSRRDVLRAYRGQTRGIQDMAE